MSWTILRSEVATLAWGWLATGAASYEVRVEGERIAGWPDSPPAQARWVDAYVTEQLSVRVAFPSGFAMSDAVHARLNAEASLVASLLRLHEEMEYMTQALVESQDQLTALYGLLRITRSYLDIDEMLSRIALEAARLVQAEASFVFLNPPDRAPLLKQWPVPLLERPAIESLCDRLSEQRRGLLLNQSVKEGIRNLLLVPVRLRDRIVGALGLLNKVDDDFTAPDRKLATAIAEQTGAQAETLLLYEEAMVNLRTQTELELAQDVQQRLLPRLLPVVPGVDYCAASIPARQVGGDFYDALLEPGGPLIFSVGDVAGKGLPAAILMATTRTVLRGAARLRRKGETHTLIERSNAELYSDLTEVSMFVTLFLGAYEPGDNTLHFANAGHSPVIYRPREGGAKLLQASGVPLGVLRDTLSESESIRFEPGDLLVVGTDGLNEATNVAGEMFGYERLLSLVDERASQPAAAIMHDLFKAVGEFTGTRPQNDDQTIIVLKRMNGPDDDAS